MGRNRVIYNVEGLFIGPAPATGYHFITSGGIPTSTFSETTSLNLIKNLPRVSSFSYGFDLERLNISAIGKSANIRSVMTQSPRVNLSFNYIQNGIFNELLLGFYVNYTEIEEPFTGQAYYADNYSVNPIGGFIRRDESQLGRVPSYPTGKGLPKLNPYYRRYAEPRFFQWPLLYRDCRNIFLAVSNRDTDLNEKNVPYSEVDLDIQNIGVYAFGNCYITSYTTSASVGSVPQAAATYVADNLIYFATGSGIHSPAIEPSGRITYSGIKCALPTTAKETSVISTLLPGDITLDIFGIVPTTGVSAIYGTGYSGTYYTSDIANLMADFSDIKIQQYSLSLNFNRKEITKMGHKGVLDRIIEFPVYINTEITALIGDSTTGSFIDYLNADNDYNLAIKLKNPINATYFPSEVAIRYDLQRAKLTSFNFNSVIGSNNSVAMQFLTEIDPDDMSKGLFISGLTNLDPLPRALDYWVDDTQDPVQDDDGVLVIVGESNIIY